MDKQDSGSDTPESVDAIERGKRCADALDALATKASEELASLVKGTVIRYSAKPYYYEGIAGLAMACLGVFVYLVDLQAGENVGIRFRLFGFPIGSSLVWILIFAVCIIAGIGIFFERCFQARQKRYLVVGGNKVQLLVNDRVKGQITYDNIEDIKLNNQIYFYLYSRLRTTTFWTARNFLDISDRSNADRPHIRINADFVISKKKAQELIRAKWLEYKKRCSESDVVYDEVKYLDGDEPNQDSD